MEGQIQPGATNPKVCDVMRHLLFLTNSTITVISGLIESDEDANQYNRFTRFREEIQALHKCIIALLTAVGIDPLGLVDKGLRISDELWGNPPSTAVAALHEINRILGTVKTLLSEHRVDPQIRVPHYDDILEGYFYGVVLSFEESYIRVTEIQEDTWIIGAFRNLDSLVNMTITTIIDIQLVDEAADQFRRFESEIRLLHRGILTVLEAIDIDPALLASEGLRISEEQWEHPPASGIVALEELRRILVTVKTMWSRRGGDMVLLVPGYFQLFDGKLENIISHIGRMLGWNRVEFFIMEVEGEEEDELDLIADVEGNELDPMADVEGAEEKDIQSLQVHIAQNNLENECSICLQEIVKGAKMKKLPCSHEYHADCLDTWLRTSPTCPIDRSKPFSK